MPRKAKVTLSQPLFGEPVFSEGVPTPDPSQFTVTNDDTKFYTTEVKALLATEVVSFSQAGGQPSDLFTLEKAWGDAHGSQVIQAINDAKSITFHMIGDSGASSAKTFGAMIKVSDAVTNDFHTASAANRPSFLFHLGDLVYNFGESLYYYDQFYEPYRNYPAPIIAIPGNHDSFVLPNTPKGSEPLTIFQRNFCSPSIAVTQEAGSLHRTSMTQPGVYFALDAPYVRIIGLFSNALEDPGVISSQTTEPTTMAKNMAAPKGKGKGKGGGGNKPNPASKTWPLVPDYQLAFLTAQLQSIKNNNYKGAVILAVHHPPFSYGVEVNGKTSSGGKHYGSPLMLAEIDAICKEVGVYPHAIISGHAHNYQRFTRKITFNGQNYSVPFIICGDSGHNVDSLVSARFGTKPPEPGDNVDVSYMDNNNIVQATGLTLNKHDQVNSGYLRVTANAQQLTVTFIPVSKTGAATKPDTVTINLAAHTAA
jgi:hypothetical protein